MARRLKLGSKQFITSEGRMQSTSINPTWLCSLCEELEETKASKPTSSRTKSVAKERPPSQVAGHPRSPQKAPGQVLNLFIA